MKVRIYNKIKHYDGLEAYFIPRQPGKKLMPALQALVQEAPEDYASQLHKVLQKHGLAYDREQWSEVRFEKFCEHFFYWHGHSYLVNKALKCLEGEASEEDLQKRFYCYDTQIFDEQENRWRPNLNVIV